MKKIAVLLLIILSAFSVITAQTTSIQSIIDEYVASLPQHAEVAIGIIMPDTVIKQGYLIEQGSAKPFKNHTRVFEIGSVTKTFTGALAVGAMHRGLLDLDEPIAGYFPEKDRIKNEKIRGITWKHLLTHTSGLSNGPRSLIGPMLRAAIFSSDNPHRYTRWKHYRKYLRHGQQDEVPGEHWVYNNCGFSLIGYLLESVEHTSWEEQLKQRLFQPLGMHHSYPTGKEVAPEELVQGYDEDGKPAGLWDMDFINPAGSIKSCVDDLVKWVDVHLQAEEGTFLADMKKHYDIPTQWEENLMGNAWIHRVTAGHHFIWHGGATGAYRSFVAFDDQQKTGIVILTNFSAHHPAMKDENGKSKIRAYGFRILEWLSGMSMGGVVGGRI